MKERSRKVVGENEVVGQRPAALLVLCREGLTFTLFNAMNSSRGYVWDSLFLSTFWQTNLVFASGYNVCSSDEKCCAYGSQNIIIAFSGCELFDLLLESQII